MKRVWDELYREIRMPAHIAPAMWALRDSKFFNPACLRNASKAAALREKAKELRKKRGSKNIADAEYLEFEARTIRSSLEKAMPTEWSEQDCAVELFFRRAYRIALESKAAILSERKAQTKKLRIIAQKFEIWPCGYRV